MVNQFPILTPNRFAFYTVDTGRQFGTQKARVGGFERESPYSGQPDIDCGGRKISAPGRGGIGGRPSG
jgi:hypothetical protein